MSTLYVRDFPEELQNKVRSLAARNQRSMSAEVVVLIEQAVGAEEARERHLQALEDIAKRRRSYKVPEGFDVAAMLREDRER